MIALLDHGLVDGSVAIDASTFRVHRLVLDSTPITIGAPTGMDDGEIVVIVCVGTDVSTDVTMDGAYADGFTNNFGNQTLSSTFVKLGSVFLRLS